MEHSSGISCCWAVSFDLARVLRSMLRPPTEHGNSSDDVVASSSSDEIPLTFVT
jgi:hypothetical protein